MFNLGALTVTQIVRLNRALSWEYIQRVYADERPEDDIFNLLRDAIGDLAKVDLKRAKEIVLALKSDGLDVADGGPCYGRELAVQCTPAFAPLDYEFARDTYLDICYGDYFNARDTASAVYVELWERLNPEQRADFDLHDQRREANWPNY